MIEYWTAFIVFSVFMAIISVGLIVFLKKTTEHHL